VAAWVGLSAVAVRLQAGVTKTTSAKNGNNRLIVFFITISSFLLNSKRMTGRKVTALSDFQEKRISGCAS
jgi:hypothetical protein